MLSHCDVGSAECCFRERLNAVNVLSINNIKILLSIIYEVSPRVLDDASQDQIMQNVT